MPTLEGPLSPLNLPSFLVFANNYFDLSLHPSSTHLGPLSLCRYGISARHLRESMEKDPSVKVHLILIASLRDEAKEMTAQLPQGCCHVCFDNTELPTVVRKILTADLND